MLRKTSACALVFLFAASFGHPGAAAKAPAPQQPGGKIVFEGWGGSWAGWDTFGPDAPTYDLWVISPDGSGLTNITSTSGADADAKWSPDGTRIVFTSNRDGDWDIYTIREDGSDLTQITNGPGAETYPDWSPDGRWIAYTDNREGVEDIWVMRADGSGGRRLTRLHSDAWELAWSPDGQRIAFTAEHPSGKHNDIYTIRRDGGGLKPLIRGPHKDCCLEWSPDGKLVVFQRNWKSCGWLEEKCLRDLDVMIARADGSRQRALMDTPERGEWDPAWSPDGKRIVFSLDVQRVGSPIADSTLYDADLFTVALDGSGLRRLTNRVEMIDYQADWQPVGGRRHR